jgi:hypothetical protein
MHVEREGLGCAPDHNSAAARQRAPPLRPRARRGSEKRPQWGQHQRAPALADVSRALARRAPRVKSDMAARLAPWAACSRQRRARERQHARARAARASAPGRRGGSVVAGARGHAAPHRARVARTCDAASHAAVCARKVARVARARRPGCRSESSSPGLFEPSVRTTPYPLHRAVRTRKGHVRARARSVGPHCALPGSCKSEGAPHRASHRTQKESSAAAALGRLDPAAPPPPAPVARPPRGRR